MDKNEYRVVPPKNGKRLTQADFMALSHEEFQALSSEEIRAFFLDDADNTADEQTTFPPLETSDTRAFEPLAPDDAFGYTSTPADTPVDWSDRDPADQPEDSFFNDTAPDGDYAPKKKSRLMGLCAFGCLVLSGLILIFIFGNALVSYINKNLAMAEIQLVIKGIVIAGAVAVIALLLSLVTYFMKRQKKGFAIVTTFFSVLIICISGVATYGYQYMFGSIAKDSEFNGLSHEELHIVQTEDDGEIVRDNVLPAVTLGRDEIEELVGGQQNDVPGLEVEWEHLSNDDIPEEALEKMNTGAPEGKSYLKGDHHQILNFALFGLDEVGSSDSIMVFSLDKVHKKIKLISIPRDSYVQVPAWGSYAKLAYPYVWGGPQWAVGTLNHNFALNISEYISVDMFQLEDIIDLVGGVEVDLDYEEITYMNRKGFYSGIYSGKSRLGGEAAVQYARMRNDSEANRTGRQREVLISVLNTIKTKSWTDYPEFIRACLGMCTTSFENEQLLELCAEVLQQNYTIEQYALIEQMDFWGGRIGQEQYFYVVYDLNRASDKLYRMIYEDLYISGYKD